MEAKMQVRYVRVTPRKARRAVSEVRGRVVLEVADILWFTPQAVTVDIREVFLSAVANARIGAEQVGGTFNEAKLEILRTYVDEEPTMKRFRPRAQECAGHILKRTSHITIVVGIKEGKKKRDR